LALSAEVERSIRGHFAALSIANETLRSLQLQDSEEKAIVEANVAARTFRLQQNEYEISVRAYCAANGKVEVVASVRGIEEVASANC